MTPLDLAQNLARSDNPQHVAQGVAIVLRGLTDDDPDTFRQGWPLDANTARAAARYVGIADPDPALIDAALALAPTLSDAILNRGAR